MSTPEKTTDNVPTKDKNMSEKKNHAWADSEETKENKEVHIAENNKKYGEWWVNNLSKKSTSVIYIAKFKVEMSTGKKVWAKNAVRVKLFNSLNSLMEEHSLFDIVNAHLRHNGENPFPEISSDTKNQTNNIGTYYVSSMIYEFIRTKWSECVHEENSNSTKE